LAQKLNPMSWSWGKSTMGWYIAWHSDKVVKLIRKRGANTVLTGRRFQAASASGVSI
jgi:hypothetical protein